MEQLQISSSSSKSPTISSSKSDSEYSVVDLMKNRKPTRKSPTCFFDPSTCQHQDFSIPEKIVYYIANNVSNATTFQKLVHTCKYFFKVNPVIVVPQFNYCDDYYGVDYFEFDYADKQNFKIWPIFELIVNFSRQGIITSLIPMIYKNDAKVVSFYPSKSTVQNLAFDEFLFATSNAEELKMIATSIEYENGEIVPFENIVDSLPKLKDFYYDSKFIGSDFTTNTAKKLMEIDHLENLSRLSIDDAPEVLNVEAMFKFIIENKQIEVGLMYYKHVSAPYKELIQEYSNRLKKEKGCNSKIFFTGMGALDNDFALLEEILSDYESSDDEEDDDENDDDDDDEDDEW